jgi:hypothetical protein
MPRQRIFAVHHWSADGRMPQQPSRRVSQRSHLPPGLRKSSHPGNCVMAHWEPCPGGKPREPSPQAIAVPTEAGFPCISLGVLHSRYPRARSPETRYPAERNYRHAGDGAPGIFAGKPAGAGGPCPVTHGGRGLPAPAPRDPATPARLPVPGRPRGAARPGSGTGPPCGGPAPLPGRGTSPRR